MGRPPSVVNVKLAHQKGFKVVMTENLDQTASRTRLALWVQRTATRMARRMMAGLVHRLAWDVYGELDAMIYVVPHEWETARYLFDAAQDRGHIIPHGLTQEALEALGRSQAQGDYLISAATIAPRKNSLLLAEAARVARVPVVFIGKAFSETDDYFVRFRRLVDDQWVRFPGFVSEEEKIRLMRGARGFVLFSQFESGCIALVEAAAAGLPLMLPDLAWARLAYGGHAGVRCVALGGVDAMARGLSDFHAGARRGDRPTFPIESWRDIAARYVEVYKRVLGR
jgi:glycosyltransferase involved in cell wall biosynthesis